MACPTCGTRRKSMLFTSEKPVAQASLVLGLSACIHTVQLTGILEKMLFSIVNKTDKRLIIWSSVMTLCFSAAKIAKNSYSTQFFTTSSPKVQCSFFTLHSSFPSLSHPFPQPSLSHYKLKAKKFEGMRDFSPQKKMCLMMKGGSLYFPHRVTCKSAPQLLEDLAVHLAEHDGGVDLTAIQLRQGVEGTAAVLVVL